MTQYVVATGIRTFPVVAESPAHAIDLLKQRIDARRNQHYNPDIGTSLVDALDQGRLNFVVMDEQRETLIAGECAGRFEQPVGLVLARSFRGTIPDGLIAGLPATTLDTIR